MAGTAQVAVARGTVGTPRAQADSVGSRITVPLHLKSDNMLQT
jgi:hypothetical protein